MAAGLGAAGCATLRPMAPELALAGATASAGEWKNTYGYFDAHGEYRRLHGQVRALRGDSLEFRAVSLELDHHRPMGGPTRVAPTRLRMPRDSVGTLVLEQSQAGLFVGAFLLGAIAPFVGLLAVFGI